jgi:hypothetical protein
VFNSAHLVDVADYVVQFIDEAHVACCPLVYRQHEEQPTDAAARDPDASSTGYAAVRAVAALSTARLLSATLDIPDAAPRVTRELRAMIAAHFLMDYQLHIPLFRRGTRDSTIARHLFDNYQSLLVFAPRRATGLAFCAELNQHTSGARFIDCDTPAEERRETLELFKAGVVWCVVSVRTLAVGSTRRSQRRCASCTCPRRQRSRSRSSGARCACTLASAWRSLSFRSCAATTTATTNAPRERATSCVSLLTSTRASRSLFADAA